MSPAQLPSNVRAVFFDLYGTLAEFYPPRETIQARAAAGFGLTLDKEGVDRGYYLADRFMAHQNSVAPVRNMSPEELGDFFARFEQLVLRGAGHDVDLRTAAAVWRKVRAQKYTMRLFDDVIPALDRIGAMGIATGLISNMNLRGDRLAAEIGLTGHVDFAVTSMDSGVEKPHPRIFRTALERAGAGPGEALHVGDQIESDVEGALAAGITPVLMDRYDAHAGYAECPRVTSMAGVESLAAGN